MASRPADPAPVWELLPPRAVLLTPRTFTDSSGEPAGSPLTVQRFIPSRVRRMVGAWCFVDYYGPDDLSDAGGMQVPPHPHCGLQTVTWLLSGEVRHTDSVGSDALISPGQLNLMTAGHGISHAENSTRPIGPILHGVQLWVALPEAVRDQPACFEHHEDLPVWQAAGVRATVLLGSLASAVSPASTFSPLVGADVFVEPAHPASLPLNTAWEYAVLVTSGAAVIAGAPVTTGQLVYLGGGRTSLEVSSTSGARLLLLGGEPFTEEIVMWWNFVARTHDEIVAARTEWMHGDRFGTVEAGGSPPQLPLPAPPMPAVTLKARGARGDQAAG